MTSQLFLMNEVNSAAHEVNSAGHEVNSAGHEVNSAAHEASGITSCPEINSYTGFVNF